MTDYSSNYTWQNSEKTNIVPIFGVGVWIPIRNEWFVGAEFLGGLSKRINQEVTFIDPKAVEYYAGATLIMAQSRVTSIVLC